MASPGQAQTIEQDGNSDRGILEIQEDIFRWEVVEQPQVNFISLLPDDLLWHIFIINANSRACSTSTPRDLNAPLVVARTCSHVCHRWRYIILHSPSLWGRLIDLDFLALIKPEWQSEILRRTGQSPLAVSGELPCVGHHHFEAKKRLLFTILQEDWSRIDSLAIAVESTVMLQEHLWASNTSNFTHISQRPAASEGTPSPSTLPLWSFMLMVAPDTPWISRITALDVRSTESMSVVNWLHALAEMPLIKSLTLHGIARPLDTYQGSARLSLPNLCEIDLNCHFRAWASILEQITPGPLRKLHLQGNSYSGKRLTSKDSLSIKKSLSRYSRNLFANQEIRYLWIKTRGSSFEIKASLRKSDCTEPVFHVRQECRYSLSYEEPISSFLETLLGCISDKVTTMLFDPSPPPLSWDRERYQHDNFASLLKLLPALGAVKTVMTTGFGVDILVHFCRTKIPWGKGGSVSPIIFPKLEMLRIWGHYGETPDNLAIFLSERKDLYPTLKKLDIAFWYGQIDPRTFDAYAGMKVVYLDAKGNQIGQHVCGTRMAEDVLIRRRIYGRWYKNHVGRNY